VLGLGHWKAAKGADMRGLLSAHQAWRKGRTLRARKLQRNIVMSDDSKLWSRPRALALSPE